MIVRRNTQRTKGKNRKYLTTICKYICPSIEDMSTEHISIQADIIQVFHYGGVSSHTMNNKMLVTTGFIHIPKRISCQFFYSIIVRRGF